MKYLVASGWVNVIGSPASIIAWNNGTIDPRDPKTLPKRTEL
jgi:hypothetical protein